LQYQALAQTQFSKKLSPSLSLSLGSLQGNPKSSSWLIVLRWAIAFTQKMHFTWVNILILNPRNSLAS
jgi:hypothetical protein